MTNKELLEEIRKKTLSYKKKIKKLKASGTFEDPIDTDMVKTTKAMFYEEVLELFKKQKLEREERE